MGLPAVRPITHDAAMVREEMFETWMGRMTESYLMFGNEWTRFGEERHCHVAFREGEAVGERDWDGSAETLSE